MELEEQTNQSPIIIGLAAGEYHSLFLTKSGAVYSFGFNS
jgi:alpha-tubulin suppressor-like RCC1 family protein